MNTSKFRLSYQEHQIITSSQPGAYLKEFTSSFSFIDSFKLLSYSILIFGGVWAILTQPPFTNFTEALFVIYFIMSKMTIFAFLIFALMQYWRTIRLFIARNDKLIVYDKGFVYSKKNFYHTILWQGITAIWQTKETWATPGSSLQFLKISVQLNSGSTLCVDDTFRNLEDFWQIVEKAIIDHLLPQVITAYTKGGNIPFGDLMVSQQGITVRQSFLPWSHIKKMTYSPKITIWQTDRIRRWAILPLERVPNVAVLKALITFHKEYS